MKKFVATLIVFFIVMGSVSLLAQDRFTLDLTKHVSATKNPTAFAKQYDYFGIEFIDLPRNINWTQYNRVIVRAQCQRSNGANLRDAEGNAFVMVFYDADGPKFDLGPNVPAKEWNIGSNGPGPISTDRGANITLTKAPGGIMLQNGSTSVAYIELLEVTFYKSN